MTTTCRYCNVPVPCSTPTGCTVRAEIENGAAPRITTIQVLRELFWQECGHDDELGDWVRRKIAEGRAKQTPNIGGSS